MSTKTMSTTKISSFEKKTKSKQSTFYFTINIGLNHCVSTCTNNLRHSNNPTTTATTTSCTRHSSKRSNCSSRARLLFRLTKLFFLRRTLQFVLQQNTMWCKMLTNQQNKTHTNTQTMSIVDQKHYDGLLFRTGAIPEVPSV